MLSLCTKLSSVVRVALSSDPRPAMLVDLLSFAVYSDCIDPPLQLQYDRLSVAWPQILEDTPF